MSRKPKPLQPQATLIPMPPTDLPQVHVKMNGVEVHVAAPTMQEAVHGAEYVISKIRPAIKAEGYEYG